MQLGAWSVWAELSCFSELLQDQINISRCGEGRVGKLWVEEGDRNQGH